MKEIISVIRINKVNETKKALVDAGIPGFTATGRVMGRGKGRYISTFFMEPKRDIPKPSPSLAMRQGLSQSGY